MEREQSDILVLEHLTKSFGDTAVLKGISLTVAAGEFLTLLGSSGCGKTTMLRIIAGLEQPDVGRVLLEGVDVTTAVPNKRNVNMVFQNYALFPHMTVAENIAYSLKLHRMPRAEIRTTVQKALALVQLDDFAARMPSELSGGQRQRVAIARAIVAQPKVLLLDEPLGALDLQLRRQMQLELKRLQKQLGITFIYITHDQEEALNMSDRIAVMREGRFEQIGTPTEIYDRPLTSYVATFVGNANIVHGTVQSVANNVVTVETEGGLAAAQICNARAVANGDPVTLAIRSEHMNFATHAEPNSIPVTVEEKTFAGGMLRIALRTAGGNLLVASRHGIDIDLHVGAQVRVTWAAESAVCVDCADSAEKTAHCPDSAFVADGGSAAQTHPVERQAAAQEKPVTPESTPAAARLSAETEARP